MSAQKLSLFLLILFSLHTSLLFHPSLVQSQTNVCEYSQQSDVYCRAACEVTNVATPLMDRAANDYYLGDPNAGGGLYHNGTNIHPQQNIGIAIAQNEIVPLNSQGEYDPVNGVIGMFSVGMSNTTREFGQFVSDHFGRDTGIPQDTSILNSRLRVIDGAQGGMAADSWANASTSQIPWTEVESRLATRGVSNNQVQVVWIKLSERNIQSFPNLTNIFKDELKIVIDKVVSEYPNTKMIFLSSRTRAHRDEYSLSPEPQAYEYGFGIKWLVEEFVNGTYVPTQTIPQPVGPPLLVPHDVFISWGPYLWIDGNNPRSDGRVWPVTRLANDCIHPSAINYVGQEAGAVAVSEMLYEFFTTDPKATPWFLKSGVTITPTPTSSVSPTISPTSSPFPTGSNQPGDQDSDGDVDIEDGESIRWNYDNKDIFEYNKYVANFSNVIR